MTHLFSNFQSFLEGVDETQNRTSEIVAAVKGGGTTTHAPPSSAISVSTTFPDSLPPPLLNTGVSATPKPYHSMPTTRDDRTIEMIAEMRSAIDQHLQDKEQLRHELREAEAQVSALQTRQAAALKDAQTAKLHLSERQQELSHLNYVLSMRDSALQEAKEALEQYKQRSKSILEQMRTGQTPTKSNGVQDASCALMPSEESLQLESKCEGIMVKLERETFAHNQTKSNLELLRVTMQELKSHYAKEAAKTEEQHKTVQDELHALRGQYDAEVSAHLATKQDLSKVRRQTAETAMRASVPSTVAAPPEDQGVSALLHDVQMALEKKRNECDALQHRLSVCMSKLRETEVKYAAVLAPQSQVGPGPDVHIDMPPMPLEVESRFFEDLSQRGWMGQRATRVATTLNYMSIVVGRYLKGNTQLRVAIMFYICVLHIWVFYVLSVAPVMHHHV